MNATKCQRCDNFCAVQQNRVQIFQILMSNGRFKFHCRRLQNKTLVVFSLSVKKKMIRGNKILYLDTL